MIQSAFKYVLERSAFFNQTVGTTIYIKRHIHFKSSLTCEVSLSADDECVAFGRMELYLPSPLPFAESMSCCR